MRQFLLLTLFLSATVLSACGNNGASSIDLPTDENAFLQDIIQAMRTVDTFRIEIEQTGAPYPLDISLDGQTIVPAVITRGTGQFIAPNALFATVNIDVGVVLSIDIFTRDNIQWVAVPTGSEAWLSFPPLQDYDLSKFMVEGEGLDLALSSLEDVKIVGETELIDGSRAFHIRGMTDGVLIGDLIFGLIPYDAKVQVDVYVSPETNRFSLVEITMLGTETATEPEPSLWHVEFYDYNEARDFTVPPDIFTEATEEAPIND